MNEPTMRQAEIFGCFDGFCDIYPNKSTEFLIELTIETMKCNRDEVCAALEFFKDEEPCR